MQLTRNFTPDGSRSTKVFMKEVEQPYVFHSSFKSPNQIIGNKLDRERARYEREYEELGPVVFASKVPTDLYGGSPSTQWSDVKERNSHMPFLYYQLLYNTHGASGDLLYDITYTTQFVKLGKCFHMPIYIYVLEGKGFLETEFSRYRSDNTENVDFPKYNECILPGSANILDVIGPIYDPINTLYLPSFPVTQNGLTGTLLLSEYFTDLQKDDHMSYKSLIDEITGLVNIPYSLHKFFIQQGCEHYYKAYSSKGNDTILTSGKIPDGLRSYVWENIICSGRLFHNYYTYDQ